MKAKTAWLAAVYGLILSLIANSFMGLSGVCLYVAVGVFVLINVFTGTLLLPAKSKRLKICYHGAILLTAFAVSTVIAVITQVVLAIIWIPRDHMRFIWSAVFCISAQAIVFWNGILCVYLTSVQLGIKERLLGVFLGMIPVANLIMLLRIIKISFKEVFYELEKEQLNAKRKHLQICKTQYPIILIHGVFFRDSEYFNYWGRIPKELEKNGAEIHYGNHQSASSVADSAMELTQRIRDLVEQLQCEKVNIIAHSKGGLDCRYAMAKLGLAPYVASLTTINTPHRGCIFANELLTKIPMKVQEKVASVYNKTLRQLGDSNPDFLAAVNDLTSEACAAFNAEWTDPEGVYCQSVGSLLKKASGGKFPLNLSYHLVKYFDGPNDGLVSESSFEWGEKYTLFQPKNDRGISHADIIDLNRHNLEDFDVREFYVALVGGLKMRGL